MIADARVGALVAALVAGHPGAVVEAEGGPQAGLRRDSRATPRTATAA